MGAITDKIKGKAKELEGKLTGDKVRTGQGKLEGAKGDIKLKGKRVADRARGAASRAKARVNRAASRTRSRTKARSR